MTRILIDPVELRRCGARITDGATELEMAVSGFDCVVLPEMPAGVAGEVQAGMQSVRSAIGAQLPVAREAAVELTRRALWAEIADKLTSGAELSDAQLRELNAWLADGSLLRYATEEQAGLAGDYVGAAYRDRFRDPEELFELARILTAAQGNAYGDALDEFSARFVESFGAENLVAVPRVIQAVEWAHVITNTLSPGDERVLRDIARDWSYEGKELEHDPLDDLLAPFSLALANATYSGRLSRTTEEAIARNDDTWATAQLLHRGVFGTRFLLECFDKGVVEKISEESRLRSAGFGYDPPSGDAYTLGRYWERGDGEGLPYDTKELILDALARNGDAAAAALTTELSGVKAYDVTGYAHDVTNPVRLLYDFGSFDDDGESFGRVFEAAGDALRADPDDRSSVDRANRLTLDVVDRVLNGEEELGGVTDALARDLADHHLYALHESAAANESSDPDGGSAGYLDSIDDRIHLSRQEVVDLLGKITEREDAGREFLGAAARFQAESILAGTTDRSGDLSWALRAGRFDQLLMEAGDMNRLEDFEDAEAQQQMIAGFANDVVSLVKVHPAVGIAFDHAIDAVTAGPSERELIRDNNRAHAVIENGLTAAIVQGYADNGLIDLSTADREYRLVGSDGRLIRYNSLDDIERARFERWMSNDENVSPVVREALQEARR